MIYGGGGDDQLHGGEGRDYIVGDDGDDVIVAGTGDDFLFGGSGANQMAGGAGADIFYLATRNDGDVIADFHSPEDDLDFSGVAGVDSMLDLTLTETVDGLLVAWGDASNPHYGHGSGSVLLQYTTLADVDPTDFLF